MNMPTPNMPMPRQTVETRRKIILFAPGVAALPDAMIETASSGV